MPYPCDVCSGSYKNPQALIMHKRSHGVLEPISGGNTQMTDTYCKDCYSKDRKNDELNHEIKEMKKSSQSNMDRLSEEATENQGHISAKELIQCKAHGPEAVKELNEQFVMFPREDLKSHEKTVVIAEKIFPKFADLMKNGIEFPDQMFTGRHNE